MSRTDVTAAPPAFDYDDLPAPDASKLKQHAAEIIRLEMDLLATAAAQGGHLREAQKLYSDHAKGKFGAWINACCPFGRTAAHKRMTVHDAFAEVVQRAKQPLNIGIEAAYLLAAETAPTAARAKAIELAESGERITKAAAEKLIAAHTVESKAEEMDSTAETGSRPAQVADSPGESCSRHGDAPGGSVGSLEDPDYDLDDDPPADNQTNVTVDAACEPLGETVEAPAKPTDEDFYDAVTIVENTITTQYGRCPAERKAEFCSRLQDHLEDITRDF